jgi:hypothetical protein
MDIGKEQEKIVVEPLEDPVPKRDDPAPAPEREPAPRPTRKVKAWRHPDLLGDISEGFTNDLSQWLAEVGQASPGGA